jgi:tRNA pseudouridine13 synthase
VQAGTTDRESQAGDFDSLPYLTADLPGVGGTIKDPPEDFVVEELAAYEPCGEGEHLFLWVQKRDVSGEGLLRHVSRRLAISSGDVGAAGVKDRRAITTQWISVPARCEAVVGEIDTDRIRVLRAARHRNKLRTGHLRGNRFSIRVRNVTPGAAERVDAIAGTISRLGFPNYFGLQRFGHDQQTLKLGLDLIRGNRSPRSIPPARRRFLLRMSLSAAQSALFNSVLARRISDGRLHSVLAGDVMQVVASGGLFVVSDPAIEQQRFDARETVPTGPMFGPKMLSAEGRTGEVDAAVLAAWNIQAADFDRFPKFTSGTRRPLLAWPAAFHVSVDADVVQLDFELPSGTYATSLLREFMKAATADGSA